MTTWGTLKARIQRALDDTDAEKWPAAELLDYARDAVMDYSRFFPRALTATLTLLYGYYPLPEGVLSVITIEHPPGRFLEEREIRPGMRFKKAGVYVVATTLYPMGWYQEGNNIYLTSDADEDYDVILHYYGWHTVPVNDNTVLTIPQYDEELISLYVQARAYQREAGKSAGLDRWRDKDDGSRRDDNPLFPPYQTLMYEYHQKICQRLPTGAVQTYVRGPRA